MIPGQAEFCLHTAQFKRWISHKEASAVKSFFGLEPDEKLTDEMYFYEAGITRLWIQEVPGKTKTRCYINVILNFARALGSRGYAAMPYTTGNVKKVLNSVSKTLKLLHLSDENSRLQEWTAVRFDSAFDIFEENTWLLMQLLNRSLNLGGTRKKCCRLPIPGKTPEESMSQSARFGNKSYVYNVYRKMEEILDTGKSFTESEKEELLHLLRIERQNLENACKKLLPDGKAGDLAKAGVREDILKTMIDEMALFFGKGDFYSWEGIQRKSLQRKPQTLLNGLALRLSEYRRESTELISYKACTAVLWLNIHVRRTKGLTAIFPNRTAQVTGVWAQTLFCTAYKEEKAQAPPSGGRRLKNMRQRSLKN